MRSARLLAEGAKLVALFGAIALVVCNMPELELSETDRGEAKIVKIPD